MWQVGRTALHLAAEKGKICAVKALISAKADLNLMDQVIIFGGEGAGACFRDRVGVCAEGGWLNLCLVRRALQAGDSLLPLAALAVCVSTARFVHRELRFGILCAYHTCDSMSHGCVMDHHSSDSMSHGCVMDHHSRFGIWCVP
jgi:hypothetical protein